MNIRNRRRRNIRRALLPVACIAAIASAHEAHANLILNQVASTDLLGTPLTCPGQCNQVAGTNSGQGPVPSVIQGEFTLQNWRLAINPLAPSGYALISGTPSAGGAGQSVIGLVSATSISSMTIGDASGTNLPFTITGKLNGVTEGSFTGNAGNGGPAGQVFSIVGGTMPVAFNDINQLVFSYLAPNGGAACPNPGLSCALEIDQLIDPPVGQNGDPPPPPVIALGGASSWPSTILGLIGGVLVTVWASRRRTGAEPSIGASAV